jgi:hypothetical protein
LIDNYQDKVIGVLDINGLNLVSYCIQEFSWECLTEIILVLGHQALEKVDEHTEATPSEFAKRIGYGSIFQDWLDSHLTGHRIDWRCVYAEHEAMTTIMFHSNTSPLICL